MTNLNDQEWQRQYIAVGYITGFNTSGMGVLNLDTTIAPTTGAFAGQWMKMAPKSMAFPTFRVNDGITYRDNGDVFSPWGLANRRAPVSYANYTQVFTITGSPELALQQKNAMVARQGVTGDLVFTYGRVAGDNYGPKQCRAMLLSVTGTHEHTLKIGANRRTAFELTAVWQQTGPFTY